MVSDFLHLNTEALLTFEPPGTIYLLTQVRVRAEHSMCSARHELDLDMYLV